MSIYTKKGDKGETSLLGGVRVLKDSLRIEVYGTLDEVTSALGLARATTSYDDLSQVIARLQRDFINVMGELATDSNQNNAPTFPEREISYKTQESHIHHLEQLIDHYQAERYPQTQFTISGESQAAAALDLARTFIRRAERRLITLGREETINPNLFGYFNRLSDLFYVMARVDEQRNLKEKVKKALIKEGFGQKLNKTEKDIIMPQLHLENCDQALLSGMNKAAQMNLPFVLSVVDASGSLVAFKRMDGALGVSTQLSQHKAYTAAMLRMPTKELDQHIRNEGPLAGIDENMPKITRIGGGIPIFNKDGYLLGAVGVSGGSVEQDIIVAEAMLQGLE